MQMIVGAVAAGSIAVACAVSYLWQQHAAAPFSLLARRQRALHQKAFVLMVTLVFEEMAHKEAFLNFWAPLADHVRAHEPGTLAFELLQPDTRPTELLVYERFLDKQYYVGVHRTSEAMATFKQRLATAPFDVKISGQSYNELNIGFLL